MLDFDALKSKLPKVNIPDLSISEETKTKMAKSFTSATKTAGTIAKYGLTFASGVSLGVICGIVLFFKISDGDI